MIHEEESVLYIKCGDTFPLELKRKFKAECGKRDVSMTEKLADLIRKWLESLK